MVGDLIPGDRKHGECEHPQRARPRPLTSGHKNERDDEDPVDRAETVRHLGKRCKTVERDAYEIRDAGSAADGVGRPYQDTRGAARLLSQNRMDDDGGKKGQGGMRQCYTTLIFMR